MKAFRTRDVTVADAAGHDWDVRLILAVHRSDGFAATPDDLRDALPGPVLQRLREQLRDDVEDML